MDAGQAARARALCAGDLDWDDVIGTARRHGLDPLLYRHLSAIGSEHVPAERLSQLRAHFETNAVRNRLLTVELAKILTLFEGHRIPAIPYKGPVLAASVYGDLALRRFADLDVLVRREDVVRCTDVLRKLGYQPRLALSPAEEAAYLASQCERNFDRDRGRLSVEVHWDIVPRDFAFRIDVARIWRTARPISFDGLTVLAPRPEDLLFMLAVHGAKHLWERLGWLCDIAELLRAHPDLDWPSLFACARERGGTRMLLLALVLAGDLLDATLPAPVVTEARRDPTVATLARRIGGWLAHGTTPALRSMQALRSHLEMREHLGARVAHVLRVALTPTFEDWAWLRLPAGLLGAHYLLRPLRLAAKHGAMRLGRAP
jgi:hypothetical protein